MYSLCNLLLSVFVKYFTDIEAHAPHAAHSTSTQNCVLRVHRRQLGVSLLSCVRATCRVLLLSCGSSNAHCELQLLCRIICRVCHASCHVSCLPSVVSCVVSAKCRVMCRVCHASYHIACRVIYIVVSCRVMCRVI